MEVGQLAEDDLHHAEADDVGACVLGAVGVVPVPVEAVGLEDSPAQCIAVELDIIWFGYKTKSAQKLLAVGGTYAALAAAVMV